METKYVKFDELSMKEVNGFDYKNMPVFSSVDEGLVIHIVEHMQDIIAAYGCITISDVYDVIEGYCPELHADKNDDDIKYGWKNIEDIYVLYTEYGVTIGIRTDPAIFD